MSWWQVIVLCIAIVFAGGIAGEEASSGIRRLAEALDELRGEVKDLKKSLN